MSDVYDRSMCKRNDSARNAKRKRFVCFEKLELVWCLSIGWRACQCLTGLKETARWPDFVRGWCGSAGFDAQFELELLRIFHQSGDPGEETARGAAIQDAMVEAQG